MSEDEKSGSAPLLARVYDDLLHHSVREIGDAVHRAIKITLAPAKGVLWTIEQSVEWLQEAITRRFISRAVEPEQVRSPPPTLLAGVVTGVQVVGAEPELRELYANLLATAMNTGTSKFAHPAFAELIRQLLPDESRLLKSLTDVERYANDAAYPVRQRVVWSNGYAATDIEDDLSVRAGCEVPDLQAVYLNNLERLGFVASATIMATKDEGDDWEDLIERFSRQRPFAQAGQDALRRLLESTRDYELDRDDQLYGTDADVYLDVVSLTPFGVLFLRACTDNQGAYS